MRPRLTTQPLNLAPDALPPLWREAWASHLVAEAAVVEAALHQAAAVNGGLAPSDAATVEETRRLLTRAKMAASRGPSRYRGLIDRSLGTSIETGYAFLHRAKTLYVDVLPERDLDMMLVDMRARLLACLPPGDIRRGTLGVVAPGAPIGTKRAALKRTSHLVYELTDSQHARIRRLRNLLYSVSMLMASFMAITAFVVHCYPGELPLCFGEVCPAGPEASRGSDVLIVVGLGVLGGVLAAAVAIRKLHATPTPYDIPLALAVLKLPTGALTALAGILLVSGGFVPGLSNLDSQQQILAYSLVFGYAQQVATRLIDQHAQDVLNRLPSRQAHGERQHMPPAASLDVVIRTQPVSSGAAP